ncbi:hypothetical protein [Enhygromyxa salina]|uniref:hypothetical protein n=1 Tax=Enhygromyxa salina TaxID=215803 RepID=UPI000D090628|nr:hypothetical protein [Enhygromyxa salina]
MPRAASLGLFAEGFVAKTCSTPLWSSSDGRAIEEQRGLGAEGGPFARRADGDPDAWTPFLGKFTVAKASVWPSRSNCSRHVVFE